MSGFIAEFFGYDALDTSEQSLASAARSLCPILGESCAKTLGQGRAQVRSGVCAVSQVKKRADVIICPIRLYADNYRLLREIGEMAFGVEGLCYCAGKDAVPVAQARGGAVAVFGQRWGGELRLPKRPAAHNGGQSGNYFMDWVLALLDGSGQLREFTAIEV